jgi:hypothetical protein
VRAALPTASRLSADRPGARRGPEAAAGRHTQLGAGADRGPIPDVRGGVEVIDVREHLGLLEPHTTLGVRVARVLKTRVP